MVEVPTTKDYQEVFSNVVHLMMSHVSYEWVLEKKLPIHVLRYLVFFVMSNQFRTSYSLLPIETLARNTLNPSEFWFDKIQTYELKMSNSLSIMYSFFKISSS